MKKGDLVIFGIQLDHKNGPRVYEVMDSNDDKILIYKGWVNKKDYKKLTSIKLDVLNEREN